ncbi:serine/threonine-protein phosphatase 7 long form-like protein, partial [Trifolium medium]|nr:serine/threonine-protein phosphatase 7 long form-like protein [Trifolium medium]
MLINHGDPLLLRWHKVKALKIDDVKLALDSATDEFVWRPYVRYSDNCGMFYPNDEIWIPFKKDLVDDQML